MGPAPGCPMTIRERLLKATTDIETNMRNIYDLMLRESELTVTERSELASCIGRVQGIGIGIHLIAQHEMENDD